MKWTGVNAQANYFLNNCRISNVINTYHHGNHSQTKAIRKKLMIQWQAKLWRKIAFTFYKAAFIAFAKVIFRMLKQDRIKLKHKPQINLLYDCCT